MSRTRRTLYPSLEPFATGRLQVSPVHEIYYEQCGSAEGQPILFLHGGPGGGGSTAPRRFFDPVRYRAVLFDQRGCGRSRPHAELADNNTAALIQDIERLRIHLGIDHWHVFGGSWGSALALLYAQAHPERVSALILRGIFLLRPHEIDWFYRYGASELFPDRWAEFIEPIAEDERGDLLTAYYRRLTGPDPALARQFARRWAAWEGATSHLYPSAAVVDGFSEPDFALAFARIEAHYFVHGGFLDHPDQILRDIDRIRHIPGVIVQGRYDVVCPARTAWDLHRVWPEARFEIVPDAGHSAFEPGIVDALVNAADRFAGE